MSLSVKNTAVIAPPTSGEAHAIATYKVDKSIHRSEIFEEIAVGQSIGAWDDRHVDVQTLKGQVAKIVDVTEDESHFYGRVAFPIRLWHGRLSWLLTLVFGKMSFYRGVGLSDLHFDAGCFQHAELTGPKHSMADVRALCGVNTQHPLLMGILKPNVAMSADAIANLYTEVAEAGVHLVKDDEIRHDLNFVETLKRIEKVSQKKAQKNLKTLYVVHAPMSVSTMANLKDWSSRLRDAGADALLVNVWTVGLDALQTLRQTSSLPLVAHPALAGALGQGRADDSVCPGVTLGTLMRAAGADLSLFPSPYGKIGLPKAAALKVAERCSEAWSDAVMPCIPVPSAGIKPEHVPLACEDFGQNFILNAGTAIFASDRSVADATKDFLTRLESIQHAR